MTLYKKDYVLIDGKYGVEEFEIDKSVYGHGQWVVGNLGTQEYGYSFLIECKGDPLPLNKDDDNWGYSPPNLEINYWSGAADTMPPLKTGDILQIEKCVSNEYGHQTVIYRVSHEDLDNVRIEVISTQENSVELKIEGESWDVAITGNSDDDDSDEKHPRSKVRIHTSMVFDEKQGPSFD